MSIDEKQTCNMHTKEKEKSGTCCQRKEEQEQAEALTYEQSFVNKVHSMVYMDETKEKNE
jgi:hypothetical protein